MESPSFPIVTKGCCFSKRNRFCFVSPSAYTREITRCDWFSSATPYRNATCQAPCSPLIMRENDARNPHHSPVVRASMRLPRGGEEIQALPCHVSFGSGEDGQSQDGHAGQTRQRSPTVFLRQDSELHRSRYKMVLSFLC